MSSFNLKEIMKQNQHNSILWIGVLFIFLVLFIPLILVYFSDGSNGLEELLVPLSGFVALGSIAISSWLAVLGYRLKLESEKRLNDASTIQSNVILLKSFIQMMLIANSRYDPILSEKVIDNLFQNKIITAEDYQNNEKIAFAKEKLETSLIIPHYGIASQEAAIGAIYSLGKDNPILLDAAIGGLTSIYSWHPDTELKKTLEVFLNDLTSLKQKFL
jgi:hypothetical protein